MSYKLEQVNPNLYEDIDDLAMDTVGYLEQQLAEKGIVLRDDLLETLYDKIRTGILDDIMDGSIDDFIVAKKPQS